MVRSCCVCGEEKLPTNQNTSFHTFPRNEVQKTAWFAAIGKTVNYTSAAVCSNHFTIEDFSDIQTSSQIRRLKRNAIPSCNLYKSSPSTKETISETAGNSDCNISENIKNVDSANSVATVTTIAEIRNSSTCDTNSRLQSSGKDNENASNESTDTDSNCENEIVEDRNILKPNKRKLDFQVDENALPKKKYRIDIDYKTEWLKQEDFTADNKWEAFQHFAETKRKEIKNLRRSNRRLRKKVQNMKDLISTLKDRNLLSENGSEFLNASVSPGVQQLISSVLQGKKYNQFPSELRNFASTLHFYSPSAYDFVRKSFMQILPHPSTLREWLTAVDYNPGISVAAIKSVCKLIEDADIHGKKLFFNLTCDEMAIRKRVEWDGKKLQGYVDFGRSASCDNADSCENDNIPEATNAFVFMLVCINGHFKIPISYYLIHSLSGKEKSTLAKEVIDECFTNGIEICNITFDGASSNISMAENLGAQIYDNTSAAFFTHKSKPIFTTLDGCHMLKLVRNTLASTDIVDNENNTISWKYIEALVNLQENEQLHPATKIRRRHVAFQNEKMRVHLASQVFSTSVAKALENNEFDLELDEFEGASATARFCQVVNDCFDVLNSKNIYNKDPGKHAITKANIQEIKLKVDGYINYLQSLKINNVPILQTNKRTGFLGLIIGMQNAIKLADHLFKISDLHFLLTYKLSQDHLETFFSCIRRCGGFNNNPTVRQFKSAIRKLLNHVDISVPLSASCIPKDDTLLISATNETDKKSKGDVKIDDSDLKSISEHIDTLHLSDFVTDVIAYISGAIVKIIKKKVNCVLCLSDLEMEKGKEAISTLQRRKCRGNLISASQDVIDICKAAEKIFRMQSNFHENNLMERLVIKTMHVLPTDLFNKNEHVFDQAPLSDHCHQLKKLILNKFFQIRLHHEAASKKDDTYRIRNRNNKLTLFCNQ